MHILLTGANGRLGTELTSQLQMLQHMVTGTDLDARDQVQAVNITDKTAVDRVFDSVHPDLVLHCAALTQVDYCAQNPDQALEINGFGTQNVALACQRQDIPLLYVSTNEVFDGQVSIPYQEYDRPHPINSYGYSKWVGEQIVRDLVRQHYIVRTSWLFAHGGKNFIHTILRLVNEGKTLRIVTNEIANPTYNTDLAQAICRLIATECYGIYHLVNKGITSRYGFACEILARLGYDIKCIEPITLAEFPRASHPPEYAALRNMAGTRLGITLRSWQAALTAFLEAEDLLVS